MKKQILAAALVTLTIGAANAEIVVPKPASVSVVSQYVATSTLPIAGIRDAEAAKVKLQKVPKATLDKISLAVDKLTQARLANKEALAGVDNDKFEKVLSGVIALVFESADLDNQALSAKTLTSDEARKVVPNAGKKIISGKILNSLSGDKNEFGAKSMSGLAAFMYDLVEAQTRTTNMNDALFEAASKHSERLGKKMNPLEILKAIAENC